MLFLSHFTHRIDKKGRVSVPGPFRAALVRQQEGQSGLLLYAAASLRFPAVECWGEAYFRKLHARIEALDPYSPERDALAGVVFGESVPLSFDGEGRVGLPAHLIENSGIKEEAVFVGKGETFEIWEPGAYAAYRDSARAQVKAVFFQGKSK